MWGAQSTGEVHNDLYLLPRLLQSLCKGGGLDVDNLRQYAISSKLFLTAVIQPFTPVIDIMRVRWRVSKQKEMTGI